MAGIKNAIINLILKGKDLLSPSTKSAADGFSNLETESKKLQTELKELDKTQAGLTAFDTQKKRINETRIAWQLAEKEVKRLGDEMAEAEKPAKQVAAALELSGKAAKQAQTAYNQSQTELLKLKASLIGLDKSQAGSAAFDAQKKRTNEAKIAWQLAKIEVKRLGAEMAETEKPTKQMTAALARSGKAAKQAQSAYSKSQTEVLKLKVGLDGAGVKLDNMDEASRRLTYQQKKLKEQLSGVNARLKNQGATAKSNTTALKTSAASADTLGRSFKRLALTTVGFIGISSGIGKIKDALVSMLTTGDKFELLQVQVNSLMGSIEAGQEATSWIKKFATETPLQLDQVTKGFTKLKAFGLDPMDGSYQAIVDQSAKLGGSQETLNGIILAVGQAWSKQKLQGEEINQLVERGVPVWDLLAKATGKNTIELQKLSSAGKIGRKEIAALIAEMGKASAGAAQKQMKTLSGLASNLKDRFAEFQNQIAESGALDYFKAQLTQLSLKIKELVDNGTLKIWAQGISDAVINTVESLKAFGKGVAEIMPSLTSLKNVLVAGVVIKFAKALSGVGVAARSAIGGLVAMGTATAAATGGVGKLRLAMLALSKTPLMLTLTALYGGYNLVSGALDKLTGKTYIQTELDAAIRSSRADDVKALIEQAQAFQDKADSLSEYSKITVKTRAEIEALSEAQRQAYATSIEGSQEYINSVIGSLSAQRKMGRDVSTALIAAQAKQAEYNATLQQTSKIAVETGQALKLNVTKSALDLILVFNELKLKGTQTSKALLEVGKNIDLKAPDGMRDYLQLIEHLGKSSQITGEQVQTHLNAKLKELTDIELKNLERQWEKTFNKNDKALQNSAAMSSILSEAMRRLSADVDQAKGGISTIGQAAIASFETVINSAEAAGLSAKEQAGVVSKAFLGAISKIESQKGLDTMTAKLRDAFNTKKIGFKEYQEGIETLKTKHEQLGNKGKSAQDKTTEATKKAKKEIKETGDEAEETGEKLKAVGESAGKALGSGLAKIINAVTASVHGLSSAAGKAFESLQFGRKNISDMDQLKTSYQEATQEVNHFATASRNVMSNSFSGYFAGLFINAAKVKEEFYGQKLALEKLNEQMKSGSLNLAQLDGISKNAGRNFNLLDKSDLSGLISSINSAKSAIDSLNNSAASTLANLQNELDQINGNTLAIEQRRFEQQKAKLEAESKKAKEDGAKQAQRDFELSLRLANDLHKQKMANLRAEQVAAAQNKRATNTNTNTNTHRSPDRTIELKNNGKTVSVSTNNETALLEILEGYGLRSA